MYSKHHIVLSGVIAAMMICATYVSGISVTPAQAQAVPVIVGQWDRLDGADHYTFSAPTQPGGTSGAAQTDINGLIHTGTWKYDGTGGYKYILTWDFGPPQGNFIDWITVAANGQTYSGVNNYGNGVNCVRVSTNQAPEAEAGPDQTVNVGTTVRLDGSASYDPDGDPLTYEWIVAGSPGGATLKTPTAATTTFPADGWGIYTIGLSVEDGKGGSDFDTVMIFVNPTTKSVIAESRALQKEANKLYTIYNVGSKSDWKELNALISTAEQQTRRGDYAGAQATLSSYMEKIWALDPSPILYTDVRAQYLEVDRGLDWLRTHPP